MPNLDQKRRRLILFFKLLPLFLLHPSSSLFCPYPSLTPTKAFRQTHVGCLFYFLLCTYLLPTIFFIVVLCVSLSFFQHSSPFWCKCVKWQLQYNFTTKSPPSFVSNVFFFVGRRLENDQKCLKTCYRNPKKSFLCKSNCLSFFEDDISSTHLSIVSILQMQKKTLKCSQGYFLNKIFFSNSMLSYHSESSQYLYWQSNSTTPSPSAKQENIIYLMRILTL